MLATAYKVLSLLVGSFGGIIGKLLGSRQQKAGAREERLRTLEGNIEAKRRKQEIEHETSRLDTAGRRSALGRFVRNDTDSSDE